LVVAFTTAEIIFRTSNGKFGQASTNVRSSASATIGGHKAADAFAAPDVAQSRFSAIFWRF
jgi:hypothetical protein